VPELVAIIQESHFAAVLVRFKQLNHFRLQVKVEELALVLSRASFLRHVNQLGEVFVGQHPVLGEVSSSPLSNLPDLLHLRSIEAEPSPEETHRVELFGLLIRPDFLHSLALLVDGLGRRTAVDLGRKHGPTTVEAHVHRDLLLAVVGAYLGSVHSYDISNSLADRQVLKLPGEEDHRNSFDDSFTIDRHRLISHSQGADEFVRFE